MALSIALTPAPTVTVLAAEPTVIVQPGDTLTAIARRHGVSVARLAELNHLADPSRIFAGQRLRVAGGGSRASDQRAPSAQHKTIHVVARGSTLWGIARHYGVSVSSIVTANQIPNPNRIFAGQRLVIPGATAPHKSRSQASAGRGTAPAQPAPSLVHVVARGSTLWGIARHYGVSISSIVTANEIANPSRIFVGQRLVIPGARAPHKSRSQASAGRGTAPADPAPSLVHVVARGSTLWGIARHYGVSISSIVTANEIANPSRIFVGQRLVIPGVKASTSGNSQRAKMSSRMAALVAERESIRRMIVREADRRGVPRRLALAVAWQESGWQQGVVSHAGAVGVMQLMPATAEWVGQTMLGHRVRIHDARSNIAAGVRLLSHYLHRYGGNRDLALAAYYQGQHAVDRYGIYPVSRPYIASVRYLERLFGG